MVYMIKYINDFTRIGNIFLKIKEERIGAPTSENHNDGNGEDDEDDRDGQSYPPYSSVTTDPPAESILFVSSRSQQVSSSKFTLDKKNIKPCLRCI